MINIQDFIGKKYGRLKIIQDAEGELGMKSFCDMTFEEKCKIQDGEANQLPPAKAGGL